MRKPEISSTKNSNINKKKLRKGLWSPEEDEKLMNYMVRNGQGCWSDVARNAGLERCGKSCRLRWINYLRPDLKRGAFSQQEEELIIHFHTLLGNRSINILFHSIIISFLNITKFRLIHIISLSNIRRNYSIIIFMKLVLNCSCGYVVDVFFEVKCEKIQPI
jgi:hypothetical protein